MKTNLRKILPLFALAASVISTPAFAYDDDGHGHNNDHKTNAAVPPAQYPGGEDALAFFVGASYTYWVPYQEGMNFAYTDGTAQVLGGIVRPRVEGNSGFKVELGANTQHDGWCGIVSYTWFDQSQSLKKRTLVSGQTYASPFTENNGVNFLGSAFSSRWNMQFNRIHGAVDRAFYAGHYLAFRPWIGLLGAWDDQTFEFNRTRNANSAQIDQFRLRQDWWGIGPYAGVDCTYYLTNEWGVFLSTGGAMLLANHDVKEQINMIENAVVTTTDINSKTTFDNVEPMMEAMLGVRWDSFWTDWALRIEAAWELQTYFSHNGMFAVNNNINGDYGNFSLQGLTIGVRVYF